MQTSSILQPMTYLRMCYYYYQYTWTNDKGTAIYMQLVKCTMQIKRLLIVSITAGKLFFHLCLY